MCRPVVIGVGGVSVLHSRQECGKALLIQLQHAGKALPLYEVERQAGQRPATCCLQIYQGPAYAALITTPWEGHSCSESCVLLSSEENYIRKTTTILLHTSH